MAAIMLQTNPSFYTKLSGKISLLLQIHMKESIGCRDYCIAHHDDKTWFLPACRYHIILLENVEELLKKLIHFASPISTWTVCIHYSKIDSVEKSIAKSGQVFDNVRRAVDFNHWNKGVDRMPSIAKKDFRGKSSESINSAPFKRQKLPRLVVQCLQNEMKKLKSLTLNWK